MRRMVRAMAGIAGSLVLAGCAAVSPLLPARPADAGPFAPLLAVSAASVAKVSGAACSGGGLVGSAFVAGDHLVLTAAHVVAGARSIELSFPGAPPLTARVVAIDAGDDTALLRVDGQLPPALALATSPLSRGDPVGVLGFPLAEQVVHTSVARVSAFDERVVLEGHQLGDLLVVDAQAPAGSSGGPVIDAAGGVQAMVSAQIAGRGDRDSSHIVTLGIPASRLADRVAGWAALPVQRPCP